MSLTLNPARDADLEFLRESARQVLEKEYPTSKVREARDHPQHYLPETWDTIRGLGWSGIVIGAEHGGEAAGFFEAAVLAEELGRVLCQSPFISSSIVCAELLSRSGAAAAGRLLPGIAKGDIVTFSETGAKPDWSAVSLEGKAASGRKAFVPFGHAASTLIFAGTDAPKGEPVLVAVAGGAPGLSFQLLKTIDAAPLAEVTLDKVAVREADVVARGAKAEELAERGLALGMGATCVAVMGAAAHSLEIAAEYAMNRVQFGRPIAHFQAVKHKLADMYSSVALAQALAYGAVRALAKGQDYQSPVAAAKVACSESANDVTRDMLQVHGGMGYTWEVDVHLFLRYAATAAAIYGTPREWLEVIAKTLPELAATRR